MSSSNPQNPSELFTPFLPFTYTIPEEEDRLNAFLVDQLSEFSDVINDKKIGVIVQSSENFSGGKYFYKNTAVNRNEYQVLVYIPSFIPQTLTLTTLNPYPIQNVNPELIMTLVYGTASLPCTATGAENGDYFSFMGQGDSRIQFTMSDTQIVITTDGARASYSGFIICTYLRNGI